jgi:hypothetical protein
MIYLDALGLIPPPLQLNLSMGRGGHDDKLGWRTQHMQDIVNIRPDNDE